MWHIGEVLRVPVPVMPEKMLGHHSWDCRELCTGYCCRPTSWNFWTDHKMYLLGRAERTETNLLGERQHPSIVPIY